MYRVYLDIETSNIRYDCEITQIGGVAVQAETFQILETFEEKLQFDVDKASSEALTIFGYNKLTWDQTAVPPELAVVHLSDFLGRYRSIERFSKKRNEHYKTTSCVAHNVDFERPRLEALFRKYQMWNPMDYKWRDTLQFAIFYDDIVGFKRESHSLRALCEAFKIERAEPHDALSDALACMEVHKFIYEQLKPVLSL